LLVRHATFIAEELAQTGVVEILTDALKDKMERVRWGLKRLRSIGVPRTQGVRVGTWVACSRYALR